VAVPDTYWEAYSYYWLIVNTRSFFSSGLARSPQRIGMLLCLSNRGDGAVHGILCSSLPYSREITHFCFAERCGVRFDEKGLTNLILSTDDHLVSYPR